jgi:RimJ/RimL family protein N-acetyltransferase
MHDQSATQLPRAFPGGLLRRLRTSDLAAFQAYRCEPELGRFQGWSPMSAAEAVAFLDEMSEARLFTPGDWVQLGIAEPEAGQLIGDIGIFLSADELNAELGFTLASGAQGHGIATAAVCQALQIVFNVTDVTQVLGITDRRNVGSVRLLERVGFRRHGSRSTVFRGEPCVEEVYVLLRNDGEPFTRLMSY